MILNENNIYDVLNEAYFGKTKEVLAIEKAVHDLRAPYISDINHNFNINTYSLKLDADPNHAKLDKAIMDAFGFCSSVTEILPTATPLFGTLATSTCIDLSSKKLRKSLRSTNNGFRYNESDKIAFFMMMPAGMLLDGNITDAELTAGILHEIGHNFSPAISRGVYFTSLSPAFTFLSTLVADICKSAIKNREFGVEDIIDNIESLIFVSNISKRNMSGTYKAAEFIDKKCPAIRKYIGIVTTAGGFAINMFLALQQLTGMLRNFFISYSDIPYNAALTLARRIAKPTGYENEKFSDTFAAMYGYGSELNSFLGKFSSYDTSVVDYGMNKIPLISAIREVYYLPFDMVIAAIDEHPTDPARAKNTIKYLEREIKTNKSLSASTKKKMLEDIKNIDEMYDFHTEEMKKLPIGSDVKMLYNKVMYKILGGDIRHNFTATHVSDDIDKAYAQTRECVDVYDTKERIGYIKEVKDMQKNKFADMFKNI